MWEVCFGSGRKKQKNAKVQVLPTTHVNASEQPGHQVECGMEKMDSSTQEPLGLFFPRPGTQLTGKKP